MLELRSCRCAALQAAEALEAAQAAGWAGAAEAAQAEAQAAQPSQEGQGEAAALQPEGSKGSTVLSEAKRVISLAEVTWTNGHCRYCT